MMTTAIATYAAAAAETAAKRLHLEQVKLPVAAKYATLADTVAMYTMARSGLTAFAYRAEACPATVDGEIVTCHLQVDVWPLPLDLLYVLSAAGESVVVGPAVAIQSPREIDVVVGMSDRVELPFLVTAVEIIERTSFYAPDGSVISPPKITITETGLQLSAVCFAVLRLRCLGVGWRHNIDISVTKQIGYKIENMACTAQATWLDGAGELQSDSAKLEIPECVAALLSSCSNGDRREGRRDDDDDEDEGSYLTVYFSTCTGKVLQVTREGENDE